MRVRLFAVLQSAALVLARDAAAETTEEKPAAKPLSELTIEELLEVQVTTIATATPKPIRETPSVVTVITAQEIEAMGATTIEEALASVPGLHVSLSAPGYRPKYMFRGVSTTLNPQVLMMHNGVPITSLLRGDRSPPATIPVEMVSRIEVIRGPGSAVWGADALTGVINIVTKSAEDLDGSVVGARGGSFTTGSGWVFHGDRRGDWKVLLGAQGFTTAGHRRIIEEDALRGTPFTMAPGPVNLSKNFAAFLLDMEKGPWRLRGHYQGQWNTGTGQAVANVLDPSGRGSGSRTLVDLTFDKPDLFKNWELVPRAAYFHATQEIDRNLVLFPPGTNLGSGAFPQGVIGSPEYWERRIQTDISALYKGWIGHRLRLGAGYAFSQIYRVQESKNFSATFAPLPGIVDVSDTADSYLPETNRHNVSALIQDEWSFVRNWELTLGARYDHYSDFGGSFNPRQALLWKISPALFTRFFYGHAFRAPSHAELYTRNNPALLGNPNLKPEQIDVFEGTIDYQPRPELHLAVTAFHHRLRDLITFVRDPGASSSTAQNTAGLIANGFEIEGKYRPLSKLGLVGNYSFQKSEDAVLRTEAGNAPHHKVYFRMEWTFLENWLITPQFLFIGPRGREPNDPRPELRGYASFDVVLRKRRLFGFDVACYVKNILDYDIREPGPAPAPGSTRPPIPGDLPQAGRSVFLETVYRF